MSRLSGRTTTLTLDFDAVSTLLGIVRNARDESEEHLDDARKTEGLMDDETHEWMTQRFALLTVLERRLNNAGLRLTH